MNRATIQAFWLSCKLVLEGIIAEWGVILIIFLVAFSSFGLGRLAASESERPLVSVGISPQEGEPRGMTIGGLIVASRTGKVYHYPWCKSALKIKPENQVWFENESAAREAGYAPAKACDGLVSD